jgi:hypothetical protein
MSARRKPTTKSVSPPLASTRLPTLIYTLAVLSTLLVLYYSYRLKAQTGAWWLAKPKWTWPASRESSRQSETVEDRINALASVLGIPSNQLASAIAVAAREYVPPAGLSSIAAKETGTIAEVLVEGVVNGMGSFVGMDEEPL